MTSPALALYLAVSRLAGPIAGPLLRRRLARGREDAARLGERLGQAGLPRPEGRLVWLHGASVGEATSALPLVTALAGRGLAVLVTTGTVTAAERMSALLPEGVLHQFVPVDTAMAVRGFLDHWQPDLAILMESELWPRLVTETAHRRIPMALVNARLSERSFRRWRLLPGMARELFSGFSTILTQDEASAARISDLGGTAQHAGNLKAMVELPECDRQELDAIRELLGGRRLWLAASTHEGEEEAIIAAHRALSAASGGAPADGAAPAGGRKGEAGSAQAEQEAAAVAVSAGGMPGIAMNAGDVPGSRAARAVQDRAGKSADTDRFMETGLPNDAMAAGISVDSDASSLASGTRPTQIVPESGTKPLLILAPRHPERSREIAELLVRAGLSFARRSAGEMPESGTDVWLADTLGEMGLWYRLAPIAFIGGSLVEVGGHTPFEPISLGAAVLHGPHVANFAPAYAALDGAGGAMGLSSPVELAAALRALMADPDLAEGLRTRAREAHEAMLPDLDAILDELTALIEVPA